MKNRYALIVWLLLFVALLTQHEFAHLAIQKQVDANMQFTGFRVLGIGVGECCEGWSVANCVAYRSWYDSPMHDVLDYMFSMFVFIMLLYPVACHEYLKVKRAKTDSESNE